MFLPRRGSAIGLRIHAVLAEIFVMKTFQCVVCGYVYDEAKGSPEEGIAPGTAWADVPDSWVCPDCGVGKADFEMIEI